MTKVIGITTEFINNKIELDIEYIEAVATTGAYIEVIPCFNISTIDMWADKIDGLIISGGQDIDPKVYCKKRTSFVKECNIDRDLFEIELIRRVYSLKKPIFGICRGMQIINVAFGGTIYQDYALRENTKNHYQKEKFETPTHSVVIKQNSWINKVVNSDLIMTNSLHHQMIEKTASGFLVTAYTDDKVIEGIERQSESFVLGLQWHPERMLKNIQMKKIFCKFYDLI